MSRLSKIFKKRKKCFIPFVTAGFPDLETTEKLILSLAKSGADIVEIGIPFSDPIADGPVIQEASMAALKNGYSIPDYLELVRRIRAKSDVGLIFMTYLNPVLQYGLSRLDAEAVDAGLDGILISDLTPEEYRQMELDFDLDTIFLVAPTSSEKRLARIADAARGFIYLVARTGVTGERTNTEATVPGMVARLRKLTPVPIAAGFGITNSEDIKEVWKDADGAIVGTALTRFLLEHKNAPDLLQLFEKFLTEEIVPQSR